MAGSVSPSFGLGIAPGKPGRPGKTPGMVKGTLPESRGDVAGRVAAAGPRPAAGPLGAPGCGASSTTVLSTSIGVPAPLGASGEATGSNPLPKELPPRVRWMTAVASVRSPFCMRRIASAMPPCIWSLMVMPPLLSSVQHLYTIHSDGRLHPKEFLSRKRGWLLRRIASGLLFRQNEIGRHHMVDG